MLLPVLSSVVLPVEPIVVLTSVVPASVGLVSPVLVCKPEVLVLPPVLLVPALPVSRSPELLTPSVVSLPVPVDVVRGSTVPVDAPTASSTVQAGRRQASRRKAERVMEGVVTTGAPTDPTNNTLLAVRFVPRWSPAGDFHG